VRRLLLYQLNFDFAPENASGFEYGVELNPVVVRIEGTVGGVVV